MNSYIPPDTDVMAAARLLIHAAAEDGKAGWSVDSLIQRMRARLRDSLRGKRVLLALEIQDFQGRRVLALADACTSVEVALAPGTYHVTTDLAGTRRRYTVALGQGASVDLHLRYGRTPHRAAPQVASG
jgi:hypothetical protein